MRIKPIRVYLENSVIGGYFNPGVDVPTRKLFDLFKQGIYLPVISSHVVAELNVGAPQHVLDLLDTFDYEYYPTSDEMRALSKLYLAEKIVSPKYEGDALHIAIATVLGVDLLVSWNFRHIVNYNRIKQFNTVNFREGYKILEIRNPMEVIENV